MRFTITLALVFIAQSFFQPQRIRAHVGTEIAVDRQDCVYFVDTFRNRLWRIDPQGTLTSLATDKHTANLIVDEEGTLYLVHNGVWSIRTNGDLTAVHQEVRDVQKMGPDGSVYEIDSTRTRIYKRAPDGTLQAFAGNSKAGFTDGRREEARFKRPVDLAVDVQGNVYVADHDNRRVRKIAANGAVTTVARSGWLWRPTAVAVAGGDVYVLEYQGNYHSWTRPVISMAANLFGSPRVRKISSDGRVATLAAVAIGMARTISIVVLFFLVLAIVAWRIRKIFPGGKKTTLATV